MSRRQRSKTRRSLQRDYLRLKAKPAGLSPPVSKKVCLKVLRGLPELVVHADADDAAVAIVVAAAADEGRKGDVVVAAVAEIVVEILGLHRPVLPHGVFDAAADRPAHIRARAVVAEERRLRRAGRPRW